METSRRKSLPAVSTAALMDALDASRYPTLIPKWAKQSSAYKSPEPEERPHRKRARSKYKRYFKAKDARKLCVDGRLPKAVILPDGIDVVVRDAFWGIPGTTTDMIILPRGLKKVQEEAFGHLTVQDYIVIPDSVIEIGKKCLSSRRKGTCPVQSGQLCLPVLRPEPPAEFR